MYGHVRIDLIYEGIATQTNKSKVSHPLEIWVRIDLIYEGIATDHSYRLL